MARAGLGTGTHVGPPCHPVEHSQECEGVTVCWEGETKPKTFPVILPKTQGEDEKGGFALETKIKPVQGFISLH